MMDMRTRTSIAAVVNDASGQPVVRVSGRRRRWLVAPALAVVTVVVGALTVSPATATSPIRPGSVGDNPIEVIGDSDGFTATDRHRAGYVSFQVRSSHPAGGFFVALKVRSGVVLTDLLENLRLGLSNDRADSVAGGRGAQTQATMMGGAAVLPGQQVSFTSLLVPGVYHLVNYQDLREGGVPQAADRLRVLTITNEWGSVRPPFAAATSVMTLVGDQARFWMPSTLRRGAPLRIVNAMPQLGEAAFMPVRPGTTREQVAVYFAAVNRDDFSVPSPFTGDTVGLPALSPGRTTVLTLTLPPGPYALVTWYPNFSDGTMLAAQGQFALVTIG